MLTQNDLDQIEAIIDERFDEKLKYLPTKDDFYGKMDEVMGELRAIREEQALMTHRLSEHEDRLEKLEELHPVLTTREGRPSLH